MGVKGFDEFSKKLDQLSRNAKELSQTKSASFGEILSPEFVSRTTRYATVDELFKAGGFNVSSQEELEAVDEGKLDAFIRSASSFASWRDMLNTAGAEWAKRKLLKG